MAKFTAGVALLPAVAMLTGCVIGPKYTKPTVPSAAAYKELGAPNLQGDWKPSQPRDDASRGKWWERFNDPRLNQLEENLNISNQTIAAAVANVQVARALIRQARAQPLPPW